MNHSCFFRSLAVVFACGLVQVGCSGKRDMANLVVVQPDTIQADGTEWQKVEWEKSLDSKLNSHFRRHPLIADNPALSGDLVCYSAASRQRVYWVSVMDGASSWAMIEFKGNQGGELVEGRGEPFTEFAEAGS